VRHPGKWKQSGYNEIQNPRKRYGLINYDSLMKLLYFSDYNSLKVAHNQWVDTTLTQTNKKYADGQAADVALVFVGVGKVD
jgi:putative transposase